MNVTRTKVCLRATLACLLVGAALGAQEGVFEFPSATAAKVLIIGKTASLKVFPNKTSSAFLTLKFGRVEELDEAGRPVYGHAVQSLAGLAPTYTTGVRTSGETDYTYVKMVFPAAALKLPECPSEEKLAELGITPAAGTGASRTGARAGAAGRAAARAAAGAAALRPAAYEPEGEPVRTLGDSRLAAAIAELTAVTADPPPRPEAVDAHKRRLAQAAPAVQGEAASGGAPSAIMGYGRQGSVLRVPSVFTPQIEASGMTKDGRDPFAQLITRAKPGSAGAVSVVTGAPAAVALAVTAGGAPSISITFFFGMTANKTFAYGKGNSIVVPADGLKWNIEAERWPFCSPLNSLRFDIAVATNMQAAAQAQLSADPAAEERTDADEMVTDMYAAPTRHLMQPGDISGALLDAESASALAAASAWRRPKLPTRTARLLVSPTRAAAVECPTVAYPSVGSAINSSVAISLVSAAAEALEAAPPPASSRIANATVAAVASANALGGSRLSITFPYFETLYYDPVVYFGAIDGMSVNADDFAPKSNCTGVVCGRTAERRANSARGKRSGGAAAAATGALVLAAVLLW